MWWKNLREKWIKMQINHERITNICVHNTYILATTVINNNNNNNIIIGIMFSPIVVFTNFFILFVFKIKKNCWVVNKKKEENIIKTWTWCMYVIMCVMNVSSVLLSTYVCIKINNVNMQWARWRLTSLILCRH